MSSKNQIVIKKTHAEFQQIEPSHRGGKLGAILDGKTPGGLAKLVARLYDIEQFQLPMTQQEFNAKFPGEKQVFVLNPQEDCPGRQTNLARGATVESPFLMMGFGILATTEGQGFALVGVMKPNPAGGATPDLPCQTGCSTDPADHPAVLAWGYPTWNIVEKFFQAYRVSMFVGRHFQIFEEAAHVMGLVGATMEFIGSGDMLISAMPFVRDTNDVALAKGCDKQFIPQNAIAGSECAPPPTALAMWGAQHTRGISNRCYPLPFPILWLPGMTIDVRFTQVEGDCCFKPAMQRDAVLNCNLPTGPSQLYGDRIDCGAGNGSVFTVPGGCFTIGAVLAGYDITPAACVEYISAITAVTGTALEELYASVGIGAYLTGKLMASRSELGGLPEDVLKNYERFLSKAK